MFLLTLTSLIVFGFLILVHEFGHFIMAKRAGVRVEQFSLGFGPRLLSWKGSDTEYSICAIPLGGYVKLAGDNPEEFKGNSYEYLSKPVGQRAKIIFFGPLLNYVMAFLCFWFVFFAGYPNLTCSVGELVEDFGAQEAGVKIGDKILAVDDKQVEVWQDLQKIIHSKAEGQVVKLSVLREGEEFKIPVRVKQETVDTIFGEKKSIGLIGIRPSDEIISIRYGPVKSFLMGAKSLFELTWLTLKSLAWIISGRISFRQSIAGPVEILFQIKQASDLGIIPLVHLTAILSMSLTIFNVLPIPVLDGGHLLLLLIEKIRGRRLSNRTEKFITDIGLSFLVLLVIFVFYNDLSRRGVFDNIYKWWSG